MHGDQETQPEIDVHDALKREKEKTAALVSILDQTVAALAQVSGQIAALSQAIRGR